MKVNEAIHAMGPFAMGRTNFCREFCPALNDSTNEVIDSNDSLNEVTEESKQNTTNDEKLIRSSIEQCIKESTECNGSYYSRSSFFKSIN